MSWQQGLQTDEKVNCKAVNMVGLGAAKHQHAFFASFASALLHMRHVKQ